MSIPAFFQKRIGLPKKTVIDENTVVEMKLSELHPFKNHPFKVLDDDLTQQTIDSISQVGVLSPAVVRPDPGGGYEIIAGHRRHHACEAAGLKTMPVIVKKLTDILAIKTQRNSINLIAGHFRQKKIALSLRAVQTL